MEIWCVEDDENICEIEMYALQSAGFSTRGFGLAGDFRAAIEKEKPDLVILDIMLPDEDGVKLLSWMRKNPETSSIPVIMASAKGSEYDKVKSLDLGADDYLAKPFGMMEMLSRVKAVLRRSGKIEEPMIGDDRIRIFPNRHEVLVDGKKVVLTLKEYELLRLLLLHPGIVFTRNQLLDQIWGMQYDGETRTVDVHIRTLRSKLGKEEHLIDTVRGVGYRFLGDEE